MQITSINSSIISDVNIVHLYIHWTHGWVKSLHYPEAVGWVQITKMWCTVKTLAQFLDGALQTCCIRASPVFLESDHSTHYPLELFCKSKILVNGYCDSKLHDPPLSAQQISDLQQLQQCNDSLNNPLHSSEHCGKYFRARGTLKRHKKMSGHA